MTIVLLLSWRCDRGKPSHRSARLLDLIGDTPLVEVTRLDRGPCRLFLKLESANPSGSIKDRPARAMIEAAEADGRLKPGGTIVEATAGNTGLGLALVAGQKSYRTILVVPDKMSREKILHARAMGAQVLITRSDVGKGHPDYYQDLAQAITRAHQGRDLHQPVREPRQSAGARDDHRAGTAAADGRRHRRDRGRRRLGRHADRRRALHEARLAEDRDDPGRSGRLGARALRQLRRDDRGRKLDGRRHRRGFRAAERRSLAGAARPIRSPTRKASPPRAICCARRASSPARRPARCSPRRCATAARRASPSGW